MSDHDWPVASNLLDRRFTADAPNQRWVGDTTEFVIGESGTLYLAAMLDLFSRFVLGWARLRVRRHGGAYDRTRPIVPTLQTAKVARGDGIEHDDHLPIDPRRSIPAADPRLGDACLGLAGKRGRRLAQVSGRRARDSSASTPQRGRTRATAESEPVVEADQPTPARNRRRARTAA